MDGRALTASELVRAAGLNVRLWLRLLKKSEPSNFKQL